jgi:putative salt-induced outer membrane protein YdiY
MADKRTTIKISEITVANDFRSRAEAQNVTQTELLKQLLDRDYSFEQTVKVSNRVEGYDRSNTFSNAERQLKKVGDN